MAIFTINLRNQAFGFRINFLALDHFDSILLVGLLFLACIHNWEFACPNLLPHLILLFCWYPFEKLKQLHPLTGSLFILKVDSLCVVKPISVAYLYSKTSSIIKRFLHLKPIETNNLNRLVQLFLMTNYNRGIKEI